jgi:hypothetical protein
MPRSRITWVIGGAVVALIVVAGVDALRSPDEEAAASATTAVTTIPFSPTTTVITVIDDQDEHAPSMTNQKPEDVVDAAGNPLPACSREQLTVSLFPLRDDEGDGFTGALAVQPIDDCRQDYTYFRIALRDTRGKQLLVWSGRLFYVPDSEDGRSIAHYGPVPCQRWEVLPAFVTVGYEPSPEGQAFRSEARCE